MDAAVNDIRSADDHVVDAASVDHVCISVEDLDAQRRWYAAAFGFTETRAFDNARLEIRGVSMVTRSGFTIELMQKSGSRPGPRLAGMDPAMIQGYNHVCVTVADVDATFARLQALGGGARMTPHASPWPGVRMAYVADPEGNLIELFGREAPA